MQKYMIYTLGVNNNYQTKIVVGKMGHKHNRQEHNGNLLNINNL